MIHKPQRATLPEKDVQEARNLHGDKETTDTRSVVTFETTKPRGKVEHYQQRDQRFGQPVDVRWYMGRSGQASVVHCSVWLSSRDGKRYLSGYGSAGGYGYCKQSAAFGDALRSMGVKLAKDVSGVGSSAIDEAMFSLADALGYQRVPRTIA